MGEEFRSKRCDRCHRPRLGCLCALIPDISSSTRLLVIQHPSERHHALNTARLLVAGLTNARLHVLETIEPGSAVFQQLDDPCFETCLLFPGPTAVTLSGSPVLRPRQLVLLDGTWRKARKMLHMNPVLRALPQVALPSGYVSRYRLRKAPAADALSTIEAGVAALELIEPGPDFKALLGPFDALIEAQIQAMGVERYQRNYQQNYQGDLERD